MYMSFRAHPFQWPNGIAVNGGVPGEGRAPLPLPPCSEYTVHFMILCIVVKMEKAILFTRFSIIWPAKKETLNYICHFKSLKTYLHALLAGVNFFMLTEKLLYVLICLFGLILFYLFSLS